MPRRHSFRQNQSVGPYLSPSTRLSPRRSCRFRGRAIISPMPPRNIGSDHEREKVEQLRRVMYSRSLSDKLKPRERRELHDQESPVGDDWVRPEPTLAGIQVAPRTIGIARVVTRWLMWSAFAFCVGALGFFSYYFVIGPGRSPVSPGNIDISVSGPLQISSGEPAELQIAVVNRNRTRFSLQIWSFATHRGLARLPISSLMLQVPPNLNASP